jgi:hypothetical protein
MNEGRKVIYSEYEKVQTDTRNYMELKEQGAATFLAFGVDYDDLDFGVGNYSTAILELDDGSVLNIAVERIRFIDTNTEE